MSQHKLGQQSSGLESLGLNKFESAWWNLPTATLYEHALHNREAELTEAGALLLRKGHAGNQLAQWYRVEHHSGDRSGGEQYNLSETQFEAVFDRMRAYLVGRSVYVEDGLLAAQSAYEQPLRLITQSAWHALFAKNMFMAPLVTDSVEGAEADAKLNDSALTIIHLPYFCAVPERDGLHGGAFVLIHTDRRMALIGGSAHAGDIKNSVAAMMEYVLADSDVLPLHAASFVAEDGASALLLGPEGSGKTTLVADPERPFLADDALGWSEQHVFNFEAGCYARINHFDQQHDTPVYTASQSFGTALEHVELDMQTRQMCFDDRTGARAAFPLASLAGDSAMLGSAKHLVLLACDGFGVLPAISRLTADQVMYYFLLGYASAAVKNPESGLVECTATFKPGCGMALMAHDASFYATALGAKIRMGKVQCWLLNTGWSGGPAGIGERMGIDLTRTLLNAALNGKLDGLSYQNHPVLGLRMPDQLDPMHTWHNQDDPNDYVSAARALAEKFKTAFAPFAEQMSVDVLKAGPQ
ncbi:MAG: phosphoenolpyruvate carboxykinase (ATP) [Mariprofundus sp.]|nr:phosphoenolpyruvate carboxykinase (ATP) [Mariprofundus sp.]